MPLLVRQARHLSYVRNLPSVGISVGRDLLSQGTLTLGLRTTWRVVPTASRPVCSLPSGNGVEDIGVDSGAA